MMKNRKGQSNGVIMAVLCVALVVSLVATFFAYGASNKDVQAMTDAEKQALAQAIGSEVGEKVSAEIAKMPQPVEPVVTPEGNVVTPSDTIVTDNDKLNDLWEAEYSDEVYALKSDAVIEILDELNFNCTAFNKTAVVDSDSLDEQIALCTLSDEDAEDVLDELVIDYDEIQYAKILEKYTEVTIQDLGLDDADDQKATVNLVIKIKYDTDVAEDLITNVVITGEYFKDKHGVADSEITYAVKA